MRIDSAVSIMFLVVGLAAGPAISQDTAGAGSGNSHSVISAISVAEHADSVDVEVTFSELVQPEVSRLEHPDRLVFDFPGCELAGPGQRFVVNRGPVLAVSSAALGVASPIARVVVELRTAQSRERASAGNKLVVNLSSSGNNLTIELGANGGSRRSALASGANKPAANSQPLAPNPRRSCHQCQACRRLFLETIEGHRSLRRWCRQCQARRRLFLESIE